MPELSREQFIEQVFDVVRKRFPLVKITRSAEPFSLRLNGRVVGLENLYRSAVQRQDESVHMIERWAVELIRAAEGTPDRNADFGDVKDRIMPVLLTAEHFEAAGDSMVGTPIIEGLYVAYVIDGDRTIAHIPGSQFSKWGVSLDDLHECAIENLVNVSQQLAADAAQDETGQVNLILFQKGDGYDSSRLLLPTLNERLRAHLGSPFLAAIPNRDILICIRYDSQILASVRAQVAQDFRTMPRQITERLFIVTADGLAPYAEPAADSGNGTDEL
jgi:uncharacterized protein YtpQ (UPF0354 family)